MLKKMKLHWLFNRSLALFLVCLMGLMLVAILINMVGIHITGTVESWQRYLTENAHLFLLWRLALYTLVIIGWLWAKKRLIARELNESPQESTELTTRIIRIELASIVAFVLLEISHWVGR